jgi:hypothetical protein
MIARASKADGRAYEQCEWCETPASYRVTAGSYRRFACRKHVVKADWRAASDLKDMPRISMTNPTGFALGTGRMLGPPPHVRGGNCWRGVRRDVCMKHEEPRGSCGSCPKCPRCEHA